MSDARSDVDRVAFRRAVTEKPEFTSLQATRALEKHRLGSLSTWTPIEANMVNTMYRVETTGASFYIKIKFRPGFSLAVQARSIDLVRRASQLPVSKMCIHDDDVDVFGHPYLICDSLPGDCARGVFETCSDMLRTQILQEYARVVATIHQIDPTSADLPTRTLQNWKERLRENLLDDKELVQALPPSARERIPIIEELLASTSLDIGPTAQAFQWGDAVLHNLLINVEGSVTGVLDFENACLGDLLEDQLFIESEFDGRHPREVYSRPEFREEFWKSYQLHGGTRIQASRSYLSIKRAMPAAGIAWFWTAAKVLPPRTTMYIEDLETVLREHQQ